jgi:hypothetical protein
MLFWELLVTWKGLCRRGFGRRVIRQQWLGRELDGGTILASQSAIADPRLCVLGCEGELSG